MGYLVSACLFNIVRCNFSETIVIPSPGTMLLGPDADALECKMILMGIVSAFVVPFFATTYILTADEYKKLDDDI